VCVCVCVCCWLNDVCLSYSARLVGSRWSALVCAAGTVFNQLI